MAFLLLIAFVSGLLTIFAPCIWPILPVVLSSSATGGRRRPLGITLGILISFTFLTLSLSYLVKIFNFDPDSLRLLAVIVIGFMGLSLMIPKLSAIIEGYASKLSQLFGNRIGTGSGFWGGIVAGVSLGLVWAPCAGPILATIAALSATRTVNSQVVLVTLVYMFGTGIPLFLFSTFGGNLLTKSRILSPYTGRIQQFFGVLMIVTAIFIWTGYDKVLQAKMLDLFPGYSNFLYKLEESQRVRDQLNTLRGKESNDQTTPKSFLPDLGRAPEFIGIENWLNSEPLTMASLKGKVVLVDFWTYSCINCIRTLPFVTGWHEKYKDAGLVVVGVHTPEFEFEKKTENVQNAIKMFNINYPVAQDNNYGTWNVFDNLYWPAKYLIDKEGRLRYQHNGEGRYEETEKAIQSLLAETGIPMPGGTLTLPDQTPQIRLTSETYLGLDRLARFGSNERPRSGTQTYTLPKSLADNNFGFAGTWLMSGEYSESVSESILELDFYANKVFLVITPQSDMDILTVALDGRPIGDSEAGKDVRNSKVILDTSRLYELIDLNGSPGRHLLQLNFGTEGIKIFAFTFG